MSGTIPAPGTSVFVPTPAFPAVNPFARGVPPVATPAIAAVPPAIAVTADGVLGAQFKDPYIWGYYEDGEPLFADPETGAAVSVVAFEFRRDEVICTAPQEMGAFIDYNKVSNPFTAKVRYAITGTVEDRAALFDAILEAEESLDLYDLVMPEVTFSNVNITRHDFQRTAKNGLTMILIDIYCEEIREAGGATETEETATPAAAPAVVGGPVAPVAAPAPAIATIPPNPVVGPGGALPATAVVLATANGNAAGGMALAFVPIAAVANIAAII